MAKLNYIDVARYLYKHTDNMSNLKLQKMMFFAYIKYYEKYGEELFNDEFEAWVYGPVLPELYYLFYKLLLTEDSNDTKIKDKNIQNLLDDTIKEYGNMDVFDLVDLTHEDPIWQKARKGLDKFDSSNVKLNIKEYFKTHVKEKARK